MQCLAPPRLLPVTVPAVRGAWLVGYAGWSAYANGAFAVIGFALTAASALGGDSFRLLRDLAFLVSTLALLPIPIVLHQLEQGRAAAVSALGALVGVVGALFTVLVQASSLAGTTTSDQSAPLTLGFGAIGVWMVVSNHLARVSRTLSEGLAWLGVAAGVGLVLAAAILALGGFATSDPAALRGADPVTAVGLVLSVLAHFASLTWALWLGRALRRIAAARAEALA